MKRLMKMLVGRAYYKLIPRKIRIAKWTGWTHERNVRMIQWGRGDRPVVVNCVSYIGTTLEGNRKYRVGKAIVTDVSTDDGWIYWCSRCSAIACGHIDEVNDAREEFEAADHLMGDATP